MEAETLPEFEDPTHLHAILRGTGAVAESPPAEWVEGLKIHAPQIRRIVINWRRGSAPYTPIPGATLELPEIVKPPKKKDGEEMTEVVSDGRLIDREQWAKDMARGRWAVAVEWAKKNGPVIDAQLVLFGHDRKKGIILPLKGGVIACRVNLTGEQSAWMDGHPTTEAVLLTLVDKLTSHIDKRDERTNHLLDEIAKHYGAIGGMIGGVVTSFQMAMAMKESSLTGASSERAADRAFMVEIAKIRATEQSVNKAVSEIGPAVREVFKGWTGPRAAPPHQDIAAQLLSTINDTQREAWKQAELAELLLDLESMLKQVSATETVETAVATIRKLAPRLIAAQDVIGNLLTQEQRNMALELLSLPGVFT